MRKTSLFIFTTVMIVTMLILSACGGAAPTKKTIALGMLFRRDEWWKALEITAIDTAQAHNLVLLVQDADDDTAKQLQQMETFVSQKVSAIIYAPIDTTTTAAVVADAHAKGIKIVCIEECLDDRSNVDSWVQFDQKKAGYDLGVMAGKFLNDKYGGNGKVAIIYAPTNQIQQMRVEGWKEGLKATAPNAVYVAEQDGQDNRATAMSVAENILTANPDTVVWFPVVEEMSFGVIAALDAKGIDPAKVGVYAEGWGQETLDNMAGPKPYLKGSIITPSTTLASAAVELVAAWLEHGTPFPKDVPQSSDLVTTENAVEYFKGRGFTLAQ
jgi:ribose transport system substrate-binding protein